MVYQREHEDPQADRDAEISEQLTALSDAFTVFKTNNVGLVHKRNTFVFNAASGTVAAHVVFKLTGRVFVDLITAFTFSTLTSGGTPAITLGTALDLDGFIVAPTGGAPGLVTGDWWTSAASANGSVGPTVVVTGQAITSQRFKLISEDIVIDIPVSTVTGGVLIFDVWYYAVTDDGALTPIVT